MIELINLFALVIGYQTIFYVIAQSAVRFYSIHKKRYFYNFIAGPSWQMEKERKMQGRILGDGFSRAFHKYKYKGMLILKDGKYVRCS